jgi:uncharacterized protein
MGLSSLSALPQRLLVFLVRAYRLVLSPWLGSSCRFEPTCSAYAIGALTKHGAAVGSYLTLRRLARCHPFCEGGHDPVPDRPTFLFRRFAAAEPGSSPSNLIDKTSP